MNNIPGFRTKTLSKAFFSLGLGYFCLFLPVDRLLANTLEEQSIALVRVSDGKEMYTKNSRMALSPASVTKLVTSAAVLDYFGPYYSFKTKFYYSGSFSHGEIGGDLIAVGEGDPYLVSEKLWTFVADLSALGIKRIHGDVVIDNSLFDEQLRDRTRLASEKKSHNAYDAPISAFAVNFNTYEIAIAPGSRRGEKAFVSIFPYPLENVLLENKVLTQDIGGQVQVLRQTISPVEKKTSRKANEKLTALGAISSHSDEIIKSYRSVGDPTQVSGEILRQFLIGRGIEVQGQVREGKLPPKANFLLALEGYPMAKIVNGLNVFSNNFIADMLVKRLGYEFAKATQGTQGRAQGSFENGMAAIKQFLERKVGLKGVYTLKNGSGLDTDNRLSAEQLTSVLCYAAKTMEIFPEFIASLPASGLNGTLKHRFRDVADEGLGGQVRAKTGTLTQPVSVASLAGYFMHKKHGLMAFAIIQNGKSRYSQPSLSELRQEQETLLNTWQQ